MPKLGKNFKWCQNCRYWGGQREIDFFLQMVDSKSRTGKCGNPRALYNCEVSESATCQNFESVL
jgi:hypothetical protein